MTAALHPFAVTYRPTARTRRTITGTRFAVTLEAASESARTMLEKEYTAAVLVSVELGADPRNDTNESEAK